MPTALELLNQLQPAQPQKSALELLSALSDQRKQANIPLPEIPIDVPQDEPVPGFMTNLAKDISNIGVNYMQGVRQSYNEQVRASERAAQAAGDMFAGQGTVDDYMAARQAEQDAARQFAKDTVGTPAIIGALAGNPVAGAIAAPIVARDIYDAAKERYGQVGALGAAKQVAGDVTGIGPASEELPKIFTQEYWQQVYEQPVTTLGGTAMALAPAALIGKGAYKGAKHVVENKTKSALELLDEIQPIKPTEGLDALDQYNSPTRGFRPATPDELSAWSAEKQAAGRAAKAEALQQGRERAIDILQRIGQQKWDETVRQYGDLIPPEAPKPLVTKSAAQLLEEIPARVPEVEANPADLNSQLAEAISKKDYSSAANIAEKIGSPSVAEAYRKMVRKEVAAREAFKARDTNNPAYLLGEGYKTSSGRGLYEAEPFDYIIKPDGTFVFGEITTDDAVRFKIPVAPGQILLQAGVDKDGHGFGLRHIKKRETELQKLGYKSAEEYISDIAQNYDRVYQEAKDGRLLLVKSGERYGTMPVDLELKPVEGTPYYTVVSALPIGRRRENYLNKKPLLFERSAALPPRSDTEAALGLTPQQVGREAPSAHGKSSGFLNHNIQQGRNLFNEKEYSVASGQVKTIWKKPSAQIVPDSSDPLYTSATERSSYMASSKVNDIIPENTAKINAEPGREYMAAGMTVPTSSPRPATPGGATVPDTISRKQIVDKIDELFTVVRQGRLGKRGVLGWFDRTTDVIRTKDYADFRAIMHEVGHYLDKGLGLRNQTAFDSELIGAVHRRFGNAYNHLTPDQLRGEGIAEFIHDYTTDPTRAKTEFPQYYAAFEQRLAQEPKVRDRLKIATDMLHTWYNQAAQERVKGAVSFGDDRTTLQKLKNAMDNPRETSIAVIEKGKELAETAYDKLIDQLAPLDRMMKEIERVTGQPVPLTKDVFKQAWLSRGWVGKAETLIEHGLPDKQIPAFKDIVKKIEHDPKGFSAYVVALRELDAYAMEAKGEGQFQHAISKTDAMRTVAEGRLKPGFVEAQQALVKYQNYLLDLLVEGGIKDRASVEAMKAKWPNYAPFFREFDDAAIEKFFGSRGFANVSDPVKKFKGSTKDIINPLESVIKNTYHFINLAERNKVGRLFVDLAQQPGLGRLIEKVTGPASAKDSTFAVWNNGKKEVYQTTPELYRAIMLLDREAAGVIEKILSIPAGWLRAGAVLSPEFIVRNPMRDAHTAFIYSKYGFIPVIDTFRGLAHVLKKDDLYWEYMNSGAAHSAMVSLDRDYLARSLREIMSRSGYQKFIAPLNPKTYIDILRAFSETLEMGTRVAEYENARRGYSGVMNRLFSNKRTLRSMEEAALAGRDVTLDFSRAGTVGKKINKVIAFWNATIQGMDKMVRAFKEDPATTSTKVFLSVTLPSIVLWYLNKDDPRYQELPQWQKDLFWIIPAKDTLIRIPKPFEVGILFGTTFERMLDWMYKKDQNAFKGYGKTVWDAMVPGWMPTALLPIVEWTSNYSYFMERNIVPPSQENLPPKLQYGPNTSAIGKGIGEILNVSPYKVDNTIRGYTGGLGGLAMTLGDLAAGEFDKRPSLKWTEYPGIRAFTATPYKSSQSVQDFYDRWNEVQQMYNEYKQTGVKPAGLDGAEYRRLQGVNEIMQKIHKREMEILSSNMSSEEKRNRLDQLNVMKANYARHALGRQKIAQ